ncbi:MAG: 50S ribosomal protein L10 [Chlamydiia bacterium]
MQAEKQLLLDDLLAAVENAPAFIITRYQGQSANSTYLYRQRLAKVGGQLEVVRKRVFLKAAAQAGRTLPEQLEGHIGVVFSRGDFVEATKVVFAVSKETEERVQVLGAWFEGRLYGPSDVKMISTLPSRDEMRAQLLGTLQAPLAEFLGVVDALLTSMPNLLNNKVDQLGGEAADAS